MRAPTTPAGSATTRARSCCSPRAARRALPLAARALSRRARSASSASPTAGRCFSATASSPPSTTGRRRQHRLCCRDPLRSGRGIPSWRSALAAPRPRRLPRPTSLQTPFNRQMEEYATDWRAWQAQLHTLDRQVAGHNVYRVSTTVLRCHESPTFPGGLIASLSIPWGGSKGDDDLGGYHLVWPRDLSRDRRRLLACGARKKSAASCATCARCRKTTEAGRRTAGWTAPVYWHGLQLDECAFPILLLDMAYREGALPRPILPAYWPMVARACGFVIRSGPRTGQDRWEENAGYTPFTLAVVVAALLAAADIAEAAEVERHRRLPARYRGRLERTDRGLDLRVRTRLAREVGVKGYYIRIAPDIPGRGASRPARRGASAQPRSRNRRPRGRRADQHRRACACALRSARRGRSAHASTR